MGSPGLECVFLFRRKWNAGRGRWEWTVPGEKLTSSDYDFDFILERRYMHLQGFGQAVSLSGRTLAVGAPYADYGNRGSTSARENFDTNGLDNQGIGRGKVYMYYSAPHQQVVTLRSDTQLYAGTWRLKLGEWRNKTATTQELNWRATASQVADALSKLPNVDEVGLVLRQRAEYATN